MLLTDFRNDEDKKGSIAGNVKYDGGVESRRVAAAFGIWDHRPDS